MKFLHSPSSSSSSSTPEIRHDITTTSCFPTALRRLLGFHSLPSLPFDHHIKEYNGNNEFDDVYGGIKLKGNPGIVAKLMGLDSMPEWRELELRRKGNCVLEAPSFVEIENEKFIILSFEGGGKDKELGLNCSKSRKCSIELKEKTKTRKKNNQEISICKSQENDDDVMKSCKLFDSKKLIETEYDTRVRSWKKKLEKDETESDSENSSPVSVLEFPDHQEGSNSGKEDSKSKILNSRRKLRGDLDKNASSSSRSSCNSIDGVELNRNGMRYDGLKKDNSVIRDFKEIWEEICKMAERDMMDSSRMQTERWKGEDLEEIGVNFELQILDQLILELFTIA